MKLNVEKKEFRVSLTNCVRSKLRARAFALSRCLSFVA